MKKRIFAFLLLFSTLPALAGEREAVDFFEGVIASNPSPLLAEVQALLSFGLAQKSTSAQLISLGSGVPRCGIAGAVPPYAYETYLVTTQFMDGDHMQSLMGVVDFKWTGTSHRTPGEGVPRLVKVFSSGSNFADMPLR